MYKPSPRQVCEFDEFNSPRGCRKRATLAIAYRQQWGVQKGEGKIPVFRDIVTFRCPEHAEVTGQFATMGISDYATAVHEGEHHAQP